MYFGTLTPDQQEYYTVFVDETGPGQPRRQGEWVYLIEAGYVNALVNLMSTILDGQTPPEQLTPTLESVP
jgi:hypothetical protein